MVAMYGFIALVIVQRLVEVVIANRNKAWILSNGGYEVGQEHYKYMVLLHSLFFVSLIIEVTLQPPTFTSLFLVPLSLFLLAQGGRVWALASLGRFWNTRIMILPEAKVVAKGPYKYMKHPNYAIVMIEIVMLPLMFQAYVTAALFSIANVIILVVRIKEEEEALINATDYKEVHGENGRFIPSLLK